MPAEWARTLPGFGTMRASSLTKPALAACLLYFVWTAANLRWGAGDPVAEFSQSVGVRGEVPSSPPPTGDPADAPGSRLAASHPVAGQSAGKGRAYVAFLCNEGMLLSTLVLVRSIRASKTTAAVIVLVTDGVPPAARKSIHKEGAITIDAPETKYPFKITAGRAKMFKQCRSVGRRGESRSAQRVRGCGA